MFSPDGTTMATGSQDGTVKLWKVGVWEVIRTLTGFGDRVLSVAFSPSGRTLAVGLLDSTIRLCEVETGAATRGGRAPGPRSAHTRASHEYPARTGGARGDPDPGREAFTLRGHTNGVTSLDFSPDGRTLASTSYDKTVKLWDVATGRETRTLLVGQTGIGSVTFSPDGDRLATAVSDGTVRVWEAASGRDIAAAEREGRERLAAARVRDARGETAVARRRRASEAQLRKQQWPAALQNLDWLIQLNPGNWRDRVGRGRALARLGRTKEAEAEFVRAVAGAPPDPEVWIERGRAYAELGQWDRAAADFTKAIDLGTGDALVPYRRAVAVLAQNDPNAFGRLQARLLAHLASRKPHDPEPWFERGVVEVQLEQWERAIADFAEAIAREPMDPGPWRERGVAYAGMEHWKEAAADLAQAIDLGAGDAYVRWYHALALLGAGDTGGYREACARMLARFGESDNVATASWIALACVLAPEAAADPARVVRLAEKAVASRPDNLLFYYVLEAALYRAGEFAQTVEKGRDLQTAAGEHADRLFIQAMAHSRLGQADAARECFDTAVRWLATTGNHLDRIERLRYGLHHREAEALLKSANPR